MPRPSTTALLAAAALALPAAGRAEAPMTTPFDGSYDDAVFAVENAIIGRGLVIDWVSHVGEMLARTGGDVSAEAEVIFDDAQVFLFCSASVSREVMEADHMLISHCPYGIFVFEKDGEVVIGHDDYPDGPMQAVEDLLAGIVADATE